MKLHNSTSEEELPDYFVTAMTIPYQERIKMQAVWQKHIDASISSTVNLPEETTIEDIMSIYMMAWEEGLKGITVFRNNCFRTGILLTESPKTQQTQQEIKNTNLEEEEDKCPICGGKLKHTGGCTECEDCGWSACSV
jgi:ribonucleoside-diphosphate reductase alpha chain